MDCDSEKYTETPQRESGWIFLRKTDDTIALIDEWLEYAQDPRIITDMPNQLGKENYEGFRENRHDQTIWSLLTKKKNLKPFRVPSTSTLRLPKDVLDRSTYPRTFCLHRRSLQRERFIPMTPQIISVAELIKNKEVLHKGFKDGLAYLVEEYVKQFNESKLPANMPAAQEILSRYHQLQMPETPFIKEALSKVK